MRPSATKLATTGSFYLGLIPVGYSHRIFVSKIPTDRVPRNQEFSKWDAQKKSDRNHISSQSSGLHTSTIQRKIHVRKLFQI